MVRVRVSSNRSSDMPTLTIPARPPKMGTATSRRMPSSLASRWILKPLGYSAPALAGWRSGGRKWPKVWAKTFPCPSRTKI